MTPAPGPPTVSPAGNSRSALSDIPGEVLVLSRLEVKPKFEAAQHKKHFGAVRPTSND